MADDDEIVVVCVEWDKKVVPSHRVACRGCGRQLAMSRSVRKELPTGIAECFTCAQAHSEPEEPLLLPTSARKEVVARLGFDPGGEAPASLREWARRQR